MCRDKVIVRSKEWHVPFTTEHSKFWPMATCLPLFELLDVKVEDWAAGMSRSGVVHFHSLRSASFRSWTFAYPLQGHWFFQVSMVVWFWHNLGLHHVVIWCPCVRSPIPLLPVPRAGDPKVRCVWSLDRRRIGRIDENLWNLLPDPVWFTTATSRGQNHIYRANESTKNSWTSLLQWVWHAIYTVWLCLQRDEYASKAMLDHIFFSTSQTSAVYLKIPCASTSPKNMPWIWKCFGRMAIPEVASVKRGLSRVPIVDG